MYLTAFLHRDQLFEITNRWLSDRLARGDALAITKIITYDSFAAWEIQLQFVSHLLMVLNTGGVLQKRIVDKKQLKDFICNAYTGSSDRSRQLIGNYRQMSEFYYVGSPMAGYIYHDPSRGILGISRFKRVKRIAEKASRYASMYFFKAVQAATAKMAPGETDLFPVDRTMQAETDMMHRFRETGLQLPAPSMTIRDILGIKVIHAGFGETTLEHAITAYPGVEIVEKERHTGNYNAVHYVVELTADFDLLIGRFDAHSRHVGYSNRGLPNSKIREDFRAFVQTGAKTVQLDLIFTTLDELIESEIGRSMHESRIFRQRQQQRYLGNIPTNVEYIIEYLLAVGLSPVVEVDEIPIKIWGRYLPDTLSYRIRKLYGMPESCLIEV